MKTTFNKSFNTATVALVFTGLMSASAFAIASQELRQKELKDQELKAQETKTNALGFGTGIVFGAAVAGPVGAAVAGLFGLFIADDINDEKRLAETKIELNTTNQQLVALQRDYQKSVSAADQQLAAIEAMDSAMTQAIAQVAPSLEANIQFKTASYAIAEHYKSQLDGLASQLRKNPNLKIELSGFADQRGESTYNQVLSEQRAKAVKEYLVSQFVNDNQVVTQSFGESELVSESDSYEDNFFDRRVLLKVSNTPADMTAANK